MVNKVKLFLKGFIVGIGKIVPGVSGAVLAINFNVYERLLNSFTNFFDDWKENLKFLLRFFSGIFLAIILFSRIILYLFSYYRFVTVMFFVGLIIGGIYRFALDIKYTFKTYILIFLSFLILFFCFINQSNNVYVLKNNMMDSIVFFIGGVIEIMASVIPGISATSLLMVLGIYDQILIMISYLFDFNFVISHINLYISYGFGMFLSFFLCIFIISYLFGKYRNQCYALIFGLSIFSVLSLFIMAFEFSGSVFNLIIGIMFMILGILISNVLSK